MSASVVPDLFLYTREGCHLCDEARATVQALLEERAAAGRRTAAIRERDIATNREWERQFFTSIPVVVVGDHRLELATSARALRRFLDDALDGGLA
jgi:hypothetical protein